MARLVGVDLPREKRVEISLLACSTAFFTSTMFASHTTSNDGIAFSL